MRISIDKIIGLMRPTGYAFRVMLSNGDELINVRDVAIEQQRGAPAVVTLTLLAKPNLQCSMLETLNAKR